MVSIEQIRLLEQKVHSAVNRIDVLKEENQSLKSKLGEYETRILELERLIESFKQDQGEIEQGILTALDELNRLEDDLDTSDHSDEALASQTTETLTDDASDEPVDTEPSEDDQNTEPENENETEHQAQPQSGELDIF